MEEAQPYASLSSEVYVESAEKDLSGTTGTVDISKVIHSLENGSNLVVDGGDDSAAAASA